jgi:glycosyltransferase involved in cell wall biosynthesis
MLLTTQQLSGCRLKLLKVKNKISFIIPVYRNEGSLEPTYDKVSALFKNGPLDFDYEFCFVDDGSDDKSLEELKQLRTKDNQVKIISFSRNFGQVPAIIAGLKVITGNAVIIMSADLQEPVELIANMIQEWKQGNEIVICNRMARQDGFVSDTASKFFYNLIKFVNPKMPQGGFDFMLLGNKAIAELNKIDERNRFFQGDVLWLGFTVKTMHYARLQRTIGRSQWTLSKKIKYFIDGLLNTSYMPIRFMSFAGMIFSVLGFLYAVVIVYNRVIHNIPFKGWAPIMILILIIGGMIMLMLGIIGEYIWRIYDETRNRPPYIIKENYL